MSEFLYEYDLTDAGQFGFAGLNRLSTDSYERRYYLDDSRLVSPYGDTLPPIVADLLDVAASIMWADRHSRRPRKYGTFRQSRGWVRQFRLTLGVRSPDLWNRPPVKEALENFLTWLTEDTWHLHFEHQAIRRFTDVQPSLFSSPPNDALVVLYSGGLDSLAGVVSLLQKYPQKTMVLVSAAPPRLSGVIKGQVQELQYRFGDKRIRYAPLPFHLVHNKPQQEEATQRTRGFLFFAFGVAEAIACGASRVLSCENGIGMLNLPFNKRQLGVQHTRAMHPQTVIHMTHLIALLGLSHVRCEAPHLLRTKGELCADLHASGHGSLCATTISCDSFPLRLPPGSTSFDTEWHCGECTSCLLRRQAIFAAHLEQEDAQVRYKYDVCSPPQPAAMRYLEPLKMMLDQVTLMKKACASFKPESALLLEFPELLAARQAVEQMPETFGLSERIHIMEAFSDLFRRYTKEWDLFPYQLRPA